MAISKDVILKQVVSNYMDSTFESDICREDEFSTSHRFDKKMSKLIKSRHSIYHKLTLTRARKIMCIAAIIIALLLASLSVESVRKLIAGFFVNHYSNHDVVTPTIETDSTYPTKLEEVYELGCVPDGYELKEKTIIDIDATYIYTNDSGTPIMFSQSTLDQYRVYIDSERSVQVTESINGIDYLISGQEDGITTVMWNNGRYGFLLSAHLSKNEALKLCESLKIKY